MSAAPKFIPHYTIEDYRLWKGDWELWNGIAIAMTPSPFGKHQDVLAALLTAIRNAIDQAGCQATALPELDWIVEEDTVVRPDLVVICGKAPEKHLEETPALIAEILSPSTRQNDLNYKRELYESQGVSTYLILDAEAKAITHHSLNASGKYESKNASTDLNLVLCRDCTVAIDPATLFR